MVRRKPSPSYAPGTYDEANFYLRSKDHQGHGTTMRIPDDIAALTQQVVNTGSFPYDTNADLVRDAIVHRLHYLLENDPTPEMRKVIDRYNTIAEIHRQEEERQHIARLIDEVIALGDEGDPDNKATLTLYKKMAATYPEDQATKILAAVSYADNEIRKAIAKNKI